MGPAAYRSGTIWRLVIVYFSISALISIFNPDLHYNTSEHVHIQVHKRPAARGAHHISFVKEKAPSRALVLLTSSSLFHQDMLYTFCNALIYKRTPIKRASSICLSNKPTEIFLSCRLTALTFFFTFTVQPLSTVSC